MTRILIADDDRDFSESFSLALRDDGHIVATAADGLEALGLIYSQNFDLSVLDVNLTVIDGSHLMRAIRKNSPACTVILTSNDPSGRGAVEAVRHGAYDFIDKSESVDRLSTLVREALDEARQMRRAGYVYKDSRRGDRSLIKNGILYAILDSALAAAAIFAGLLLQDLFMTGIDFTLPLDTIAALKASLGLGFCYALVFVLKRCHRVDLAGRGQDLLWHLWRNLSLAYMIFLTLLFLGGNNYFAAGKEGVVAGYIFGYLLLVFSRTAAIPAAKRLYRREGRRNLVLTSLRPDSHKPDYSRAARVLTKSEARRSEPSTLSRAEGDSDVLVIGSADEIRQANVASGVKRLYISPAALCSEESYEFLGQIARRGIKITTLDISARAPSVREVSPGKE